MTGSDREPEEPSVPPAPTFRPRQILATLTDHRVEFVLIGGLAATFHGSPHLTQDVDITPSRDPENLARLSGALIDMAASVRASGVDGGLPFAHDAQSIADVGVWNLTTRYGDLDISFVPTGTKGFDDLVRDAVAIVVEGVEVTVASLADVVRSKQAADREKDRLTLPTLREILARRLDDTGH
ncbi:MAG TPA: hypothetical protein VK640_13240 [Actinomycetes bacterium]|nr:hypothetical protein [Actinomycetes bacterium]